MKILLLTLCSIFALSTFASARDHHGMTPAQIAEQDREDEDYERNKELYDKLDEINDQLKTLNEGQQDQEDTQPQPRVQTFADYTNASPDRVEIGQFFTRSGHRVIALYEINGGQCTQANLIMPDGSKIKVDIEKGTKPVVIDQSLQRIVDKQ